MSTRRAQRTQATTDWRTAEERLEALVREPNAERSLRTLMRIRRDLEDVPQPGRWISAARTLSERLIISEDAFYYFTEIFTECMLFSASAGDEELLRIRAEMHDLERAHGLREDEMFRLGAAPAEWTTLNDAWNERAEVIISATLRQSGHADVADARQANLRDFERRVTKGRIELWGKDDAIDP